MIFEWPLYRVHRANLYHLAEYYQKWPNGLRLLRFGNLSCFRNGSRLVRIIMLHCDSEVKVICFCYGRDIRVISCKRL